MKNLMLLKSLCLPKSKGGLSIADIGLKCNALLLKQALRMIGSGRECRNHVEYWIGDRLGGDFGFDTKYVQLRVDQRGRKLPYNPKYFKHACSLLLEGLQNNRFDVRALEEVTTKSIYASYLDELPPHKIFLKHPDRNWPQVWSRLNSGYLLPTVKDKPFFDNS